MTIHPMYDRPDDMRYRIDADAATEILRMLTEDDDEPDPLPDDRHPSVRAGGPGEARRRP